MSAIPQPAPDAASKQYPEKISNIVSEISKLTLVEVADLNELLKKTLNIQVSLEILGLSAGMNSGPPTPSFAHRAKQELHVLQEATVVAAAAPAAAAPVEEEDEPQIQKIQTTFTVKLTKFDETKKINLIKELKNLMEGTNLVQVRNFGRTRQSWSEVDAFSNLNAAFLFPGEEIRGKCSASHQG